MPPAPLQPDWPKVWRCPACRYEMTGAPGPICPECGIDAIAEHERRRARRYHYPDVSPEWFLPAAVVLMAFVPSDAKIDGRRYHGDASGAIAMLGVGWLLALAWLWTRRDRALARGATWRLVIFASVTTFTSWRSMTATAGSYYNLFTLAGLTSLAACAASGAWILTKGRSGWTLAVLLGFLLAGPGLLINVERWTADPRATTWSVFADPRPGQIYDQYPLRWDEVRLLGPVVLLAGAAITLAGLSLRRRTSRDSINRLSSPPPSHAPYQPATSPPPRPPS